MRKVLKGIKVLLTSVGCPGGPSVARALKVEGAYVVGVDADGRASGRFDCDEFHVIPRASEAGYVSNLLDLARSHEVDALLPQSENEVVPLALDRSAFEIIDAKVLASDPVASQIARHKAKTYKQLLQEFERIIPKYHVIDSLQAFIWSVDLLGLSGKSYIVKPTVGAGSRGVRVIRPRFERLGADLRRWPNSITMTEDELFTELMQLNREGRFPELMVMEYLHQDEGVADTVDLFIDGDVCFGFTKTRGLCREGVHWRHRCVRDDKLLADGIKVARALGLRYFVNLQFRGGKLMEVNPRISTQFVTERYNMPAIGVACALGLATDADLARVAEMPEGAQAQYYLNLRTY